MSTPPNATPTKAVGWRVIGWALAVLAVLPFLFSLSMWFMVPADPSVSVQTNILIKLKYIAVALLVMVALVLASKASFATSRKSN